MNMKRLLLTAVCVLCAGLLSARTPAPAEAVIPDRTVSLVDYGGVPDGITLNTEAFTKAINALSKQGGGHLNVPEGIFLTGAIVLKDNIDLHLERGAVILMSPDKRDLLNGTSVRPGISASKRHDISISGEGIIDGNGAWWRAVKRSKVSDTEWKEFRKMGGTVSEDGSLWYPFGLKHYPDIAESATAQESLRTHLIRFTDCQRVTVKDVTIQNAPKFHLVPQRCTDVIIDGVTVRCPWNAQNGDGIDIDSCEDVEVSGCDINTADDSITLRADVARLKRPRPCARIRISGCRLSSACNAVRIGVGDGMVHDAAFRKIEIYDTRTAVDFVSSWRRGGKGVAMDGISFDGMNVEAVLFCRMQPKFAEKTRIGNISFANVTGRTECASWITGREKSPVGTVKFENVRLPHGVVCLNAPDVRVSGGDFERKVPTAKDADAYNRDIEAESQFPCTFKGTLYDSIQERRMKSR